MTSGLLIVGRSQTVAETDPLPWLVWDFRPSSVSWWLCQLLLRVLTRSSDQPVAPCHRRCLCVPWMMQLRRNLYHTFAANLRCQWPWTLAVSAVSHQSGVICELPATVGALTCPGSFVHEEITTAVALDRRWDHQIGVAIWFVRHNGHAAPSEGGCRSP